MLVGVGDVHAHVPEAQVLDVNRDREPGSALEHGVGVKVVERRALRYRR
jgi:hypothetical protein